MKVDSRYFYLFIIFCYIASAMLIRSLEQPFYIFFAFLFSLSFCFYFVKKTMSTHEFIVSVGVLLFLFGFFVSALYNDFGYQRLFVAITYIAFFLSLSQWLKRHRDLDTLLFYGFFFIVIACSIFYYYIGANVLPGRLDVYGSTRQIANYAGIAAVIFSCLSYEEARRSYKSLCIYAFVVLLLVILITQSRGVLVGVMASFFSIFAFSFLKMKKSYLHSLSRFALSTGALLFIPIFFVFMLEFDHERLMSRLLTSDEYVSNARWEIWWWGLRSLDGWQYFFGSGPNSFDNVIYFGTGGVFDMYAHSVYVDTYFSGGVISVIGLLMILLSTAVHSFKKGSLIAFSLVVYSVASYLFHGTATRPDLWLLLSLAVGISLRHSNEVSPKAAL